MRIYLFSIWILIGATPTLLVAQNRSPHADKSVKAFVQELRTSLEKSDEARQRMLEAEAEAARYLKNLEVSQKELSKELKTKTKQIDTLRSVADQSKIAATRAQQELEVKRAAIENLEAEQSRLQAEFDGVSDQLEVLQVTSAVTTNDLTEERNRLKTDLETITENLNYLRQSQQAALEEKQALEQMNQELTQELSDALRRESLANAKAKAMSSRMDTLRDELAEQFKERSRLEQENEDLRNQVSQLDTALQDALENRIPIAEVEALKDQLATLLAENAQLAQGLEAAQRIPDLRQDFAAVERERDLLSAQRKTLDKRLDQAQKSLEKEQQSRRDLSRRNRDLESRLEAEQQRSRGLEKDIRALEAGLEAAETSGIDAGALVAVRRLLEDMKEENKELKTKVRTQQETVDTLMHELTEKENERNLKIRELQGMLGQQLEELAGANDEIRKLGHTVNELDFVREQKAVLVVRQEKSRQDMKVLAKHIYHLRDQLRKGKEIRVDLEKEKVRAQQLTINLRDLRQELTTLNRMQQTFAKENAIKEAELRKLRGELQRRNAEKRALESELDRLKQP